jgi:hypothetical protein
VLLGLLLLIIALAVGDFMLLPGPPDANLIAKSEQVRVGMSLDELKAVIGEPTRLLRLVTPKQNQPPALAVWEKGDTVLRVELSDKLLVTSKTCGTKSFGRRLDDLMGRLFSPRPPPSATAPAVPTPTPSPSGNG